VSSREDVRSEVDNIGWYHTIHLDDGIHTNGSSDLEIEPSCFPDFAGRDVLDVGAWDGKYSFLAERLGAAHVVALDHYSWQVDFDERNEFWKVELEEGRWPDASLAVAQYGDRSCPGMQGFNFARTYLNSHVEPLVDDFMTMDLDNLRNSFDVVLFLGVLYHLDNPMTALRRLRQVIRPGGVAVIETLAIEYRDIPKDQLTVQFAPGSPNYDDYSVLWVPTHKALTQMLIVAGFSSTTQVGSSVPDLTPVVDQRLGRIRNAYQRWRGLSPSSQKYRLILHATA
jgi:tRNA (mo5U34)-methyltransferase